MCDEHQERNLQIAHDLFLDASGLTCPLPILRAKKALKQLAEQEKLLVVCTDQQSVEDFKEFDSMTSHSLLRHWQESDRYFFLLERGI